MTTLFVIEYKWRNMYLRFTRNSEVNASGILDIFDDMFSICMIGS